MTPSNQFLLCTDLDRTLLPNGFLPENTDARARFAHFVSQSHVRLAYVSGRSLSLVEDAIREYELPPPDWIVGDVGSTLYRRFADDWERWCEWEKNVAVDWHGLKAESLKPFFSDLSALRLQESEKQNDYKLSYYLCVDGDHEGLMREMGKRLNQHHVAASLIFSTDEAAHVGLLDVLPARATKLHAVEFIMREAGFDETNTVFAGDSGNDLPVLASGIQSVLVANAMRDVVAQAESLAAECGNLHRLYFAQGGFLGMNGNYSAGILEGIAFFHPETLQWMEAYHA